MPKPGKGLGQDHGNGMFMGIIRARAGLGCDLGRSRRAPGLNILLLSAFLPT